MSNTNQALQSIKISRAIWPVLIGFAVVGYLMHREFDSQTFENVEFTWRSVACILLAICFMFGRDIGYMIRIRILSEGKMSWRQAFRVIMLWEFTSAITPSAIGGTSVAVLYVHKEGISLGNSSTIVLLTSFLDELYFLVVFPLIIFMAGIGNLFDMESGNTLTNGFIYFAIIGYSLKALWVIMLGYGLFINPRAFKMLLMRIFSWRILKRWRRQINQVGNDIVAGSKRAKGNGIKFWGGVLGSTFLSWSSRYLVANALIMAFFGVSNHLMLFARQLVMWVMMLVMPTPGGSGFAEVIFSNYCADLINVPTALQLSAATLIAFLWRGITYYPYLAIGAFVFPRWLSRNFGKQK